MNKQKGIDIIRQIDTEIRWATKRERDMGDVGHTRDVQYYRGRKTGLTIVREIVREAFALTPEECLPGT